MSALMHLLLHRRQQTRSYMVLGAGAQIPPTLLLVSASHGGRSSKANRCSSSSVWRRPSVRTSASGEVQTIEQDWEEYFADPLQWWDSRFCKVNPKSPDYKHKVTKKVIWVDGWSTPPWVTAMLKLLVLCDSRSHGGCHTSDSQEIVQPNRSPEGNYGRRITSHTGAKASMQAVQVGGGSIHMQIANTTIEAIDILKIRRKQGIAIDSYTYVEILKRCLKQEDLTAVQQVHECTIESGMQQNIYVANNLLSGYIRCGRLEDARRVFDELVKKSVISWNVLIGGYAQHSRPNDVMKVYNQMRREGVQPDAITYLSILKACARPSALKCGEKVHTYIRQGGFESDLRVGTALLKMYAKCGSLKEARKAFDNLASRDVISWNVMIGAYAESGCGEEAYRLLLQMKREGFKPTAITYLSILNASAGAVALEWVREVDNHAREAGLDSDVRVGNALVHMYATCGSVDDAGLAFDRMEERNVISWNSMIGGLAKRGCGSEAFGLLLRMKREGFKPTAIPYVSILNAHACVEDLEWVREVHSHAREAGFESDVRVGHALIHMYAKCRSIDDARLVFDRMDDRDLITWNVMIGGLAKHECGSEAFELFLRMKREGIEPSAFTYMSILNPCASAGALEWVKDVHGHAREAGFDLDLRVGNALVHMYAKCGSIDDARLAFDRMENRDVISWNVMIGAYAESGYGEEAYRLLLEMKRKGLKPDAFTYASILNASASAGALEWVKDVHGHVREAGFDLDLRVGTALVHMYSKCGSIDDARLTFDRMENRDVISWNVMIGAYAESGYGEGAYRLLLQMKREGLKPDAFTYASVLNASASAGALEWVKEVHGHAREAGFDLDLRVGNALVHMYSKCGSIDDARLTFDRMENRDLITWNVMIGGLAQHGCGSEAFELFLRMKREGFEPSTVTYMSILNPCTSGGTLEWVKEVQSHAREARFESDVRVGTALVRMYAKCGSIDDARLTFDRMENRDVISWNVMIGAYAESGYGEGAYRLLLQMKREGLKPDAFTYASVLNASASAGALEWVKDVHGHAREAGFDLDLRVGNALVHMYAKCGSIDDARLTFDRMENRDVISWNVMIGAYAESGYGEGAYRLLLQMKREGLKPDAFTYASILNASASAGALEWVKEVHGHVREAGFDLDLRVGNALVHMYSKCGSIDDARLTFDRMEERDLITWNVMIGGLAQHGCGSEALEVFRNMNVTPDGYSFVALLSACSHAGLVDEGRRLFLAMSQDYGIVPGLLHWTCMVDILGRAGHLEEAKLLVDNMPVEPDGTTWGALLGACRSYRNLELGELAAEECVKLEPDNASSYVLLSNIYAAAEKWEEVSLLQSTMQERGIRKEPGRSWIEVDSKIHTFVVGDTSHPETKEIYAELSRLTEKIEGAGYLPDTRLVLHDVVDEDKEFSLCSHSEKLAIAYGLIHTPSSKPIRVYKNLRVCLDCHIATKLISKVCRKEIVVRDANRFHHFKDGLCSCNDYW